MNTVAILAGGKATRLYPITLNKPKCLIPIHGKAFIDLQLDLLARGGINHVVLCLGNMYEQVVYHIQDLKKRVDFELDIEISIEGESLGTGGAIANALDLLGNEFGVLYGDSYLPINYGSIMRTFRESQELALMTVFKNNNKFDKSNAIFDGSKVVEYTKTDQVPDMNFIDYGFLVFKREVFARENFPRKFDISQIVEALVQGGEMSGLEVKNRFYEVGSFQGIRDLENYLRGKK